MQLSLADQRADYGQTVLLPRRQAQVTRTVSRQSIHVAARLTLDLTSSYPLCGGTSRSRATLIYPTPPTGSIGAGDHFPAHRLPQAASLDWTANVRPALMSKESSPAAKFRRDRDGARRILPAPTHADSVSAKPEPGSLLWLTDYRFNQIAFVQPNALHPFPSVKPFEGLPATATPAFCLQVVYNPVHPRC